MHRGAAFVQRLIETATGPNATPAQRKHAAAAIKITARQASHLEAALADDSQDYYYSACLSVVDGIRGLDCGFYTWATVKLYYSVFYALRSCLAANRTSVFYVESTPYSIEATAGSSGVKGSDTTHGYVLDLFGQKNPGHAFIGQTIENAPALRWLRSKREASSYRIPRFSEPAAPDHFKHVDTYGIRRLVGTYLADTSDVYTFDKDHAMLALPLRVLTHTGRLAKGLGAVRIEPDELTMLTSECCDDDGQLTAITAVFRDFAS